MKTKLALKTETISTLDLDGVVGGAARKKIGDNGKAAFMKIWHQIAEQQSGSYR